MPAAESSALHIDDLAVDMLGLAGASDVLQQRGQRAERIQMASIVAPVNYLGYPDGRPIERLGCQKKSRACR